MADRWALTPEPYVQGGLALHGFTECEDAERFASLFLPDWEARPVGAREEGHRAVCADCGGDWPCDHVRVEREARTILHESRHRCHVCSQSTQFCLRVDVKGGGDLGQDLTFHGRQGKCRTAALKLLRDLGRDDELERLEAAAAMRRERLADRKQAKQERARRVKDLLALEASQR